MLDRELVIHTLASTNLQSNPLITNLLTVNSIVSERQTNKKQPKVLILGFNMMCDSPQSKLIADARRTHVDRIETESCLCAEQEQIMKRQLILTFAEFSLCFSQCFAVEIFETFLFHAPFVLIEEQHILETSRGVSSTRSSWSRSTLRWIVITLTASFGMGSKGIEY